MFLFFLMDVPWYLPGIPVFLSFFPFFFFFEQSGQEARRSAFTG